MQLYCDLTQVTMDMNIRTDLAVHSLQNVHVQDYLTAKSFIITENSTHKFQPFLVPSP